jgi:phytanoyl-CoA hydroxylase
MVTDIRPHPLPEELSPEHIEAFHRDGYCVVDGLWTGEELGAIEAFFEEYKRVGTGVFDGHSRYEEIDPKQRQLRAMHPHRHSAQARSWALHPKVLAVLEVLLGAEPLLAQTMYYFKPPGAKGQGMHQDDFYLLTKPHTCIAAWTAIDAATQENGCLYVAPGSQKKNIICPKEEASEWMSYGDSHIKPFPRDLRPVPVAVPRGSTMFVGGHLVHGSGPNRSADRWRRTFIGHYIDDVSEQIASFYHPVLNRHGETVDSLHIPQGGGPCGDGWLGAVH